MLVSPRGKPAGTLFAADASGVVRVSARCLGDAEGGFRFEGSGFLLGPQIVMTARHVLVDAGGKPCAARVQQETTGHAARVVALDGDPRDEAERPDGSRDRRACASSVEAVPGP